MKIALTILFLFVFSFVSFAQTDTAVQKSRPFVLGTVETLHSNILGEDRILNIYLPEGYDKAVKYPVIYLLDGSADEDFVHVVGIVQFNTFPWIERIPKSIVIGIANTNRKYNFTAVSKRPADQKMIPKNGGSTQFIDFIEKELQPYVDKKYSTTHSRMIIGQSLGGLLATEILFTRPRLFNKYVIISPSIWWNDGALLKENPDVLKQTYPMPTDIYIGVGKEGSMDGTKNHIMENDAKLLYEKIKQGRAPGLKVYFNYLPEESHATVTHQAIFNAFRLIYPKP